MREPRDGSTRQTRCAIYTRKSTEEGLEQEFNSLDAQREACAAYILSQRHEGWIALPDIYDDGGYSGGNMERPGIKMLMADMAAGKVDVIVVYKVDRLTRSLADFAKIVEVLDARGASFVSVTQSFNTTSSVGRLTLNVLLSFAQFEREVTGERIRDKIAASKAKGMWMGGPPPLGYDVVERKLVMNEPEADVVRHIYQRYVELGSVSALANELELLGVRSKARTSRLGKPYGSARFRRGALYALLKNVQYVGQVSHKGELYQGQHHAILDRETFDAAQRQLEEGRVERRLGDGSPDPSLLAGLLWDAHGRPMSPSHSIKRSMRYRYYNSRTDDLEASKHPIWRVSAPDIETGVIDVLTRQLKLAVEASISSGACDAETIERIQGSAADTSNELRVGIGRARRGLLERIVERVELHEDKLVVTARFETIDTALGDEPVISSVAINCVRSGKLLKLIFPPNDEGQGRHRNRALIKLVVQAAAARDALDHSSTDDFNDVAAAIGQGREHSLDLLRVGYLAPDIISAILDGRQPPELTRSKLIRAAGVPLCWKQQRAALGFA